MRRAFVGAAATLLVAAGCSAGASDGDRPEAAVEPTWSVACEQGEVPIAPLGALSLPCLGDGAETAVGVSDRPLVLVLWASWCRVCAEEAPEIEAFYQAHGDRIDVLGVDTADTAERGRWFAEDFGLTFPSVFDADETVRIALGVPGVPAVAFVAPDGTVTEIVAEPGVTTESLTETAVAAFGMELA